MFRPNYPVELPVDLLSTITENKRLRNAIAHAHTCVTENGVFRYKKALYYPNEYIVTEGQIATAKAEIEADKQRVIDSHKGEIIFIGMGMTFASSNTPIIEGAPDNHRFRAEFINYRNRRFFIEFSHSNRGGLVVNHSIDRNLEICRNDQKSSVQDYNNYLNLERSANPMATYRAVLALINTTFDCNFTGVFIDSFTLGNDHVSISPAKTKM